jgi:hypothetical protein
VSVGLDVGVVVDVAKGDGWNTVGVGVWIGEDCPEQEAHTTASHAITTPDTEKNGRILSRAGEPFGSARGRAVGRVTKVLWLFAGEDVRRMQNR